MAIWLAELFSTAHSAEWITGITGAGGAILGSAVTIAWTEWFNRRTRGREARERTAAASFSALHRLNQIYSDMTVTRDHLADSFITAHESGLPHLCLAVRPLNRLNGALSFPTDELRILWQVGGMELLNLVNAMDRGYNVVMDLMEIYRTERPQLIHEMEIVEHHGEVTTVEINQADLQRFALRFGALDEHLEKAHEFADDLATNARRAIELLVTSPKLPFGPTFKIELKGSDGEVQTVGAPKKADWRARWKERLRLPSLRRRDG